MNRYLLQEDGMKLVLEDLSGALLLDSSEEPVLWAGQLGLVHGKVYFDSWQHGDRPNPFRLRW